MSTGQRIIKYLAIAFGLFLCINIIGIGIVVVTGIFGITEGFNWLKDNWKEETEIVEKYEYEDDDEENFVEDIDSATKNIKIDVSMAKINILKSDSMRVEIKNNSKNIKTRNKNGTYTIEDNGISIDYSGNKVTTIINVYVPEDKEFKKIDISTGASDTHIESLKTEQFDLEAGAGLVSIGKITVSNQAKIDGGAGRINIEKAEIKNLELNCGMGDCNLGGKLIGNNSFECGVGNLTLNLEGDLNYYRFKTESGIGAIRLNHSICQDGVYGEGENRVIVEGGMGTVNITTKETTNI